VVSDQGSPTVLKPRACSRAPNNTEGYLFDINFLKLLFHGLLIVLTNILIVNIDCAEDTYSTTEDFKNNRSSAPTVSVHNINNQSGNV